MNKFLKEKFALTDSGVKSIKKATILSFIVYMVQLLPAILIMIFIDDKYFSHGHSNNFYYIYSVITLLILFTALYFEYTSLYDATYSESANLRVEIINKLKNLPLHYFSKHNLSDLAQTIMSDVDAIEHALSHSIPKIIGAFIFLIVIAIMLISGNVILGLVVIIPVVISIILLFSSKKIQDSENKKYYDILRDVSETFQETIEMQQEIKSYGMSESVNKNLYQKLDLAEKIHFKTEFIISLFVILSNVFLYLSTGFVMIIGINLFMNDKINLVYLIGYILASMKLKEAIEVIVMGIAEVFYLDPKVKRINEIKYNPIQKGEDVNINSYDIEVNSVSFSYNEDNEVLKNINFTAKQNEVTALVGLSGCGKTSLLRLISRLYDYQKGKIEIDGKNIKDISTKSLFENISIVFQDVNLFNNTIMENIRIGRLDATDEEVIQAAKLANCEEFIEKLPNKFNEMIGENGAKLSGGERQRISIARAFLKNANIILLDEISASLDIDNESKIQDSLNKLIEDKTVVIISHRLKSIENVNKIVVIDKGLVESEGSHQDLLEKSDIYKNLIEKSRLAEEFQY